MQVGRAKAWFLTGSVALTSVLGLWAAYEATRGPLWPWVWSAVAALAYPLRIGTYYVVGQRTTPKNMPGLLAICAFAALMTGVSVVREGAALALLPALAGPMGALTYVFWYSRLHRSRSARIAAGEQMPDVTFKGVSGETVRASSLFGTRVLYMFYRGNWCPLCMAQIRDVAAQYKALDARGVRIALVSPQPHENTASLAKKFDVPMLFLVDEGLAAAQALGIVHAGGLPAGFEVLGYEPDTVLPTVILVEQGGTILWADETDNYRVRPDPETFLAVLDRLAGGQKSPRLPGGAQAQ
jgi:peroxiredoxin